MMAYPCEGTKAFARCFPLLATSVSFVIIGRFMLQSRMFYHMLMKKTILDFNNYTFHKDPKVLLLFGCFSLGMLHFIIDLCYPPYLFNQREKMNNISYYVAPCVVFFFVFESACNIERHLVTINKFYEDDPAWASNKLDQAKFFAEDQIAKSLVDVQKTLHEDLKGNEDDHRFSIDFMLDKIIDKAVSQTGDSLAGSRPSTPRLEVQDDGQALFKGLWPAQVLLARHLTDSASKSFKKSMSAYMVIMGLAHFLIVSALICASLKDVEDARILWHYERQHDGTEFVAGAYYKDLGSGYCRDDSMQRPDCYWIAFGANKSFDGISTSSHVWKAEPVHNFAPVSQPTIGLHRRAGVGKNILGFLATSGQDDIQQGADKILPWASQKSFPKERIDMCAAHCKSQSLCIGFSVSDAFCTIYTSKSIVAPLGWTKGAEAQARSASVRRSANIVQTSKNGQAHCWKTAKTKREPQDFVGSIVNLLHVFIVVYFLKNVVTNMWPKYLVKD